MSKNKVKNEPYPLKPCVKAGKVLIIGRPNSGKSTLINSLVGKKISIVTPKPQTTRRTIQGLYWDDTGQIIFSDSPGIFQRVNRPIFNLKPQELENHDLIVYLIDHTRYRGDEENRILGIVRKTDKPKIIGLNKIDVKRPDYTYQYKFLEDEFDDWVEISGKRKTHLKTLIKKIYALLPESEPLFNPKNFLGFPSTNVTPKQFVAEIIREKAFLNLQQEIPYQIGVVTQEIKEENNLFKIYAVIYTGEKHYKPMLIGKNGKQIKKIGVLARKELELITCKKVFLDLQVKVNQHWPELIIN